MAAKKQVYEFLCVLRQDGKKTVRYFKTVATTYKTARDRAGKKYPYPWFIELNQQWTPGTQRPGPEPKGYSAKIEGIGTALNVGDIVEWKNPYPDEIGEKYIILEEDRGRVLMQSFGDYSVNVTKRADEKELKLSKPMANAIKKISARAKQIQKSYPKMTWRSCIEKASAEYRSGKISGAAKHRKPARKKSAHRAAPKKHARRSSSKRHTDTRSHNVNIRVVSGVDVKGHALKSLENELAQIKNLEHAENMLKVDLKRKTLKPGVNYKKSMANIKRAIRERKKNISNLKRLV